MKTHPNPPLSGREHLKSPPDKGDLGGFWKQAIITDSFVSDNPRTVSFQQVIHSGQIEETGVTGLHLFSKAALNEHPQECPTYTVRSRAYGQNDIERTDAFEPWRLKIRFLIENAIQGFGIKPVWLALKPGLGNIWEMSDGTTRFRFR